MLKTGGLAFALVTVSVGLAVAAPPHQRPAGGSSVTLVANGCGPGYFRTIAGDCRPNRRVLVGPGQAVVLPPPCPRGFRRDPDPRRPLCYPIF